MSLEMFKNLEFRPKLTPISRNLSSPGGNLNPVGSFIATVQYRGTNFKLQIIVVKNKTDSLLSRNACVKLNLVHRVTVKPDIQDNVDSTVSNESCVA